MPKSGSNSHIKSLYNRGCAAPPLPLRRPLPYPQTYRQMIESPPPKRCQACEPGKIQPRKRYQLMGSVVFRINQAASSSIATTCKAWECWHVPGLQRGNPAPGKGGRALRWTKPHSIRRGLAQNRQNCSRLHLNCLSEAGRRGHTHPPSARPLRTTGIIQVTEPARTSATPSGSRTALWRPRGHPLTDSTAQAIRNATLQHDDKRCTCSTTANPTPKLCQTSAIERLLERFPLEG